MTEERETDAGQETAFDGGSERFVTVSGTRGFRYCFDIQTENKG